MFVDKMNGCIQWNITRPQKIMKNAICSIVDGPRDYCTKWSKSERERQMMYFYVEYKIWHKWTYIWKRNRLTDMESRLVVDNGEGGQGGKDWEFGICRQIIVYRTDKQQDLLCHRGNYSQYPVINHHGKEYEKVYIYTRNWITRCTA